MRKGSLRVALAQINTTVGDLEGNTEKIIESIRKAEECRADIVSFPEMTITGYPPEDLLLKSKFIDDNLKELKKITRSTGNIMAVVGFVDRVDKDVYNAAAVIRNKKIEGIYHKMLLPNYGVFDEKRYFRAGQKPLVFKMGRIIFGVNICEDIWGDGPIKSQVFQDACLIVNISASPYHAGKTIDRERLIQHRARSNGVFIVYTNLIGGQDELVFDGNSLIVDNLGKTIARAEGFKEDLVIANLEISCNKAKKLFSLGRKIKKPDSIEEIYEALVLGLRDYVMKNGFEKLVIGLSGGIDSSLVSLIACDAIGKNNVVGVSMPSRYSSGETQRDAELLSRNLGTRFILLSIDSIFDIYLSKLEKYFSGNGRGTAEENIQARIRGNILMAFSNKFGWLVLATGNKSETSTGYCTLYGDMAGGFAVIKDVPKTLVYELARHRCKKEHKPLIPESVFTREPTAELKYEQKDTDVLPEYGLLDPILRLYIEEDKSIKDIVAKGFSREAAETAIQMVDKNEYKRRQAPPGVKITPKAFGKDRRMPITNKYRGF